MARTSIWRMMIEKRKPPTCALPQESGYSGVTVVSLSPRPALADYLQAMQLANAEAERRLGGYMLLSWYDRDRDYESPRHASECHADSATAVTKTNSNKATFRVSQAFRGKACSAGNGPALAKAHNAVPGRLADSLRAASG